jgi:hypothetical protein
MIANDRELQTTLERIDWFQEQVAQLRRTETNLVNYRAAFPPSWPRLTACSSMCGSISAHKKDNLFTMMGQAAPAAIGAILKPAADMEPDSVLVQWDIVLDES